MTALAELLKHDVRLPSPPAIALRILDIVKHENFSFNKLATVIQSDPALAVKILRLANCGIYSLPNRVSSIDTAIAVLGVNALKNIALSFVIWQGFKGGRGERFDFDRWWRRSIVSAGAAQLLAAKVGIKNDGTFITALLQDIGIAAMFACRKQEYTEVLDEKAVSGLPITTVERKIFGFDHQEIGSELLKLWGLPESIYLPIRYHHEVENVPPALQAFCNVLRASGRLSGVYYGSNCAKNVGSAKEILFTKFGMDNEASNALIDSVAEKSIEILAQFEIEARGIKPFSQILQEANEELGRLNLSYEMLIVEHKEAKQNAEQLAVELKKANDMLRDLAYRDGLTGLYNHGYFQEAIVRELSRAERYKRPVALILFDLDHFKKINDTYGHQRGDIVLKTVGHEIERSSRTTDVVARYGGEEFAIILPETTLSGAIVKAEACRAAIEAMRIEVDAEVIRTTISVGVACYDASHPLSKSNFIDVVDRALYRAKQAGRNRVSSEDSMA